MDGKHGMENFDTTDLRRFSWLGKLYIHKKNTAKSPFKQIRITNDTSHKT